MYIMLFILFKPFYSNNIILFSTSSKWSRNVTYTFYRPGKRPRLKVNKLLKILWLKISRTRTFDFESDFSYALYFLERVKRKTNLCLTGITTHECCMCFYVSLESPQLQKRKLSFYTKCRVIIKTIIYKISKKDSE